MIIETSNLKLVSLSKEHAEGLFKLWSNIDVVKYTYNIVRSNINECEEWIKKILKSLDKDKDIIPFSVFFNNKIIGFAGAPTKNYSKGEYRLFYQFDNEYWGKGYGCETAKAIIDYMFKENNAQVIYADAVTFNKGSIRILEKIGMQKVGINKNGFKKEQVILDLCDFRITKNEWEKKNKIIE